METACAALNACQITRTDNTETLIAISSLFSSLFTNKIPLSLCFSTTLFHSCFTLFTLKEISLLFATLTKTTPGYNPVLENFSTAVHPTQRNPKMERATHSTTEFLATD